MNNNLKKEDWEYIFSLIKKENMQYKSGLNKFYLINLDIKVFAKRLCNFENNPDIGAKIKNLNSSLDVQYPAKLNIDEYCKDYINIVGDKIQIKDAVPELIKMCNDIVETNITMSKVGSIFAYLNSRFPDTLELCNESINLQPQSLSKEIGYTIWSSMINNKYKKSNEKPKIPEWISKMSVNETSYYLSDYNTSEKGFSNITPFFQALKLCDQEQVQQYLLKHKDSISLHIKTINFIKNNFDTKDIYTNNNNNKINLTCNSTITLQSKLTVLKSELCGSLKQSFTRHEDYIQFFIFSIRNLNEETKKNSVFSIQDNLKHIIFTINQEKKTKLGEIFTMDGDKYITNIVEGINNILDFFQNDLPQLCDDNLIILLDKFKNEQKINKEVEVKFQKNNTLNEAYALFQSFNIFEKMKDLPCSEKSLTQNQTVFKL